MATDRPTVIASPANPLVKQALAVREGRRPEAGTAFIEGARLIDTALQAGVAVERLFTLAGSHPALAQAVLAAGGTVSVVTPAVLRRLTQTVTPQGAVAIVRRPAPEWPGSASLAVVLAGVADPGNAGTIIRAADAVGADLVVCAAGTVSPYNAKAVRASMGSLFHVPVVTADASEALSRLRNLGLRLVLADAAGDTGYLQCDFRVPVAIVLGGEAAGAGRVWRQAADATVRIPLFGRAESLNVALAAAVLLYEARRQRRA